MLKLREIFDRMLSSGMQEQEAKKSLLQKQSQKLLIILFRFLYGQPFTFNEDEDIKMLSALFRMAHMYDFKKLVELCVYDIESWVENHKININNFSKIFEFGTVYEIKPLIIPCLKWAEKHKKGKEILISLVNNKNIAILPFFIDRNKK